jgi:Xaa-Pro aminopeptidase
MKNLPLNPLIFKQNRQRFIREMEADSIAIFVSNDEIPSNGDALYPFKQNSDLYWLTGIVQEDTMLVLFPDHPDPKYRTVLILTRPNELKEKWDGKRLRAEEGKSISGIATVVWLDAVDSQLQIWIHLSKNIYLDSNENDRKSSLLQTREYRFIEETKKRYPLHRYLRAATILKNLRAVKTAEEVEVIQKAIDITANTFLRVMQFMRPGVFEYELEAEIQHSFLSQRSGGPAYGSILASGENACTLHYVANNQLCADGDLVLMDFGAEYGGYNADLTRTIPVNGKFTKRQKQVYNACLHLHQYAKGLLKPGISINDYHVMVGKEADIIFQKIGLLTKADVRNATPEQPAYWKYLYHGISHHLGIDVHDLGPRAEPLLAGMVLTVEPGIYIQEEKLGVRIENNVWLTKTGNKDLMKDIPISAEEIEAFMKNKKLKT